MLPDIKPKPRIAYRKRKSEMKTGNENRKSYPASWANLDVKTDLNNLGPVFFVSWVKCVLSARTPRFDVSWWVLIKKGLEIEVSKPLFLLAPQHGLEPRTQWLTGIASEFPTFLNFR